MELKSVFCSIENHMRNASVSGLKIAPGQGSRLPGAAANHAGRPRCLSQLPCGTKDPVRGLHVVVGCKSMSIHLHVTPVPQPRKLRQREMPRPSMQVLLSPAVGIQRVSAPWLRRNQSISAPNSEMSHRQVRRNVEKKF